MSAVLGYLQGGCSPTRLHREGPGLSGFNAQLKAASQVGHTFIDTDSTEASLKAPCERLGTGFQRPSPARSERMHKVSRTPCALSTKPSKSTRSLPRLDLLARQLTNYENMFNDLGSKMLDLINERPARHQPQVTLTSAMLCSSL